MSILFHRIIITQMKRDFPAYQFQLALTTTSKIKASLEQFIAQFKRQNMAWIIGSLESIYDYMHNQKADLNCAFNSLFAVKFIIDTGDIHMINLIETYLLPKIVEIASFDLVTPQGSRGSKYFMGRKSEAEISLLQYYGFNYIRIASQLIMASAQIKPNRLFSSQELQIPSDFELGFQKLKNKGFKPYTAFAFYKTANIKQSRKTFVTNLESFGKTKKAFEEHYLSIIRQFLIKGKKVKTTLDIQTILEKGEMPICNWILEECFISLQSIDLCERRRALMVINDFVRWGDVLVAYAINCQGRINHLVQQIADASDPKVGMNRAKTVLKMYQNSPEQKLEYYVQLLKSVQFWATCYPCALKVPGRISAIKQFYEQLKQSTHLEFPENKDLKAHYAVHYSNNKKKHKINTAIIKYLTVEDGKLVYLKPLKHSREVLPSFASEPSFERFRQQILTVRDILNSIYHQDNKILEYIPILNQFQSDFDVKIQNGHFNTHELEYIVSEGAPLLQRIERIMPALDEFKAKRICLQELKNILLEKNKEITMSRIYNEPYCEKETPSKTSKIQISSSIIKNSLDRQLKDRSNSKVQVTQKTEKKQANLLKKPILKYTESYDFALSSKPYEKEKRTLEAKPSKASFTDSEFNEINYDDLLYSKDKNTETLPKVIQPFESIPTYKGQCAATLKKIQHFNPQAQNIFHKYNPRESKISEKKYQDDRSDRIGSSNLGETMQPSFGLIKLQRRSQQVADDEEEEKQSLMKSIEIDDVETEPLPISYQPLFKQYATSKFSFEQFTSLDKHKPLYEQSQASCNATESAMTIPPLQPQQFSYQQVRTAEDIIQKKPATFLGYLQMDQDYIPVKKRAHSLKLLESGSKDIIRPKSLRKTISISSNLNSVFKKKPVLFKKDITAQKEKKLAKPSIENNELTTKLLNRKLNLEEKMVQNHQVKKDRQPPTLKLRRASIEPIEDNFFKEAFLNSRKRRNSLNQTNSEFRITTFGKIQETQAVICCGQYKQYFSCLLFEEDKKNQLRNRALLLKNEYLEIGCTNKVEDSQYYVTLFVTARLDIKQFGYKVSGEENIDVVSSDAKDSRLVAGKQRRIRLQIKPHKIPYKIPTIHFNYRIGQASLTNNHPLPCAFQKFVPLDPPAEEDIISAFKDPEQITSTEELRYSGKVLKSFTQLSELLPNGTFLRGGTPNSKQQVQYAGRATIKDIAFLLKITLKPDQMFVVAVSLKQVPSSIRFLMATIGILLSKK